MTRRALLAVLGVPPVDSAVYAVRTAVVAEIVGFSGFHRREQVARSAAYDAFVLKPNFEELLALVTAEMASRAKAAGDA